MLERKMLGNRRKWSIVLEVTELVCIFALSEMTNPVFSERS
jgi:hypothetical protein